MPRFFFHLHEGQYLVDEEGLELADLSAARQRARDCVLDILSAEVKQGHLNLNNRIDIADESGAVVEGLLFRDALKISG